MQNHHLNIDRQQLAQRLVVPLFAVAALWVVHFIALFFQLDLGWLGVFPRKGHGIFGILTSPLIHGDLPHLTSNSLPLFVLMLMMTFFYRKIALPAMIWIYLLTGLMVWLFARQVYHIGASGVVYGLVSFVFWCGIFVKDVRSVVLALIVTFLYSGMFEGVLPHDEGISWESHLFGALVGLGVAFRYKRTLQAEQLEKWKAWEEEQATEGEKQYFLPRDIFEKTKAEREQERFWGG